LLELKEKERPMLNRYVYRAAKLYSSVSDPDLALLDPDPASSNETNENE
jgi:hypothetical protein